jgi:predicted metalloendopeptidase
MSGLVFRESPIQKDQSLIYDAFEMFGGPVLGTYLNVERGLGLVNEGEVYRGIEAMVPSSIRAFMRAYRYAEAGGAETMRGDQITPLDSWDVAVQLLGYTPEDVIRTQEAVGREKRITEAIRSKKNKLYKRFNLALVDGDYEELSQIQMEMFEFMQKYPDAGRFDLKASIRGFQQRSKDMVGGVYIPKQFQPRARESLEEYGREELQ